MNLPGINQSAPARVILRDAAGERWLRFTGPRQLVKAGTLGDVKAGLGRVEEGVVREGLYAAGFVSYEAAPAFDRPLAVNDNSEFPLLWFGLYEGVEEVELPVWAPRAEGGAMEWQASVGKAEFCREVARIKALIRSGDTYQVNYTYRLRTRLAGDPWDAFLRLVAAQDPPYGALWTPATGWSAALRRSCSSGWTARASNAANERHGRPGPHAGGGPGLGPGAAGLGKGAGRERDDCGHGAS